MKDTLIQAKRPPEYEIDVIKNKITLHPIKKKNDISYISRKDLSFYCPYLTKSNYVEKRGVFEIYEIEEIKEMKYNNIVPSYTDRQNDPDISTGIYPFNQETLMRVYFLGKKCQLKNKLISHNIVEYKYANSNRIKKAKKWEDI